MTTGPEQLKQELKEQRAKELEEAQAEETKALVDEAIAKANLEKEQAKQIQETGIMKQYFYNALIMAGITFFSTLKIDFPPRADNLWAAGIAGGLALLVQLKSYYNIQESRDQNLSAGLPAQTKPKRPPLGMLIW